MSTKPEPIRRPPPNGTMDDEREVLLEPSAIGVLNKSEIDIQIATAKRYPRNIHTFRQQALELATLTPAIASECIYALRRQGRDDETKIIEGPSARLAEIVASSWGNCRAGARVISEGDEFVCAQGAFFDLERNVAISFEVKRRITDRHGRRYSPDMIGVTANAACSIALRNAVLKGVPKALWVDVYEAVRKTIKGDEKSLVARRTDAIKYFEKLGVSVERVLAALELKGVEDIGLDELVTLKGLATAIAEGDTTVAEAFPLVTKPGEVSSTRAADPLSPPMRTTEELERLHLATLPPTHYHVGEKLCLIRFPNAEIMNAVRKKIGLHWRWSDEQKAWTIPAPMTHEFVEFCEKAGVKLIETDVAGPPGLGDVDKG